MEDKGIDSPQLESTPSEEAGGWDGLELYPKAVVDYWNDDKEFGFVDADGQKYYLDTRDIFPAVGKGNPKDREKFDLHLVDSQPPKRSGQSRLASCVWGKPKRKYTVTPAKFKSGDNIVVHLARVNEDGTLTVNDNIVLPPGLDLNDLELGAGFEVAVYDGTQMYSAIECLGHKKIPVGELRRDRESKKHMPMANAYSTWMSRKACFENGRRVTSEGEIPENSDLRYKSGWHLTLDGEDRVATIDWDHGRLIIKPITKSVTERRGDSNVDDFGDVGQAIGGNSFRSIGTVSRHEVKIRPSREFDLPTEIAKVPEENIFDGVTLANILTVEYLHDRKERIPINLVAVDQDGTKFAFWSEKYKCWRRLTDKNAEFLDKVKGYNTDHYSSSIKPDDHSIGDFFSMIRMAQRQHMNLGVIAPWLKEE